MITTLFQTGNSNAIRLNKQILKEAEITDPKQKFDISVDSFTGKIVIEPIKDEFDNTFLKAKELAFKKNVDILEYLKDK